MSALVDTAPLIGHVVGGQVTTPEGSRTQDVFDPATGQVTGRVLLAEQADVDAAVAAAVDRRGELVAGARRQADRGAVRAAGADRAAHRRAGRDHHGRARQGAGGLARGDRPRARGHRVRVRHARSCSRASTPTRRPRASTCSRSGSRWAWSPASPRSTSPRWCRCGWRRWRSRPATRSSSSRRSGTRRRPCSWRGCGRRPGFPTGSSPWCRATGWPSTRCSRTRTSRPCRSSGRRRSRSTCTPRRPPTASGCRPSAARRTTRSCWPTPTWTSRRRT